MLYEKRDLQINCFVVKRTVCRENMQNNSQNKWPVNSIMEINNQKD